MGKRVDYEGMISIYDTICRQRPLSDYETTRLAEIIRLRDHAESQAKYRAAKRDALNERQRAYYKDNAKKCKKRSSQYNITHNSKLRQRAKDWRARNPDKVEQYNRERREREENKRAGLPPPFTPSSSPQ